MPKPPILPVPDRQSIFANGRTWEDWLNNADEPSQAERLRANYDNQVIHEDLAAPLADLSRPVQIIAIAETWCGDVILHTPLLVRLIERTNGLAQMRFVKRADHPDFFARFLTNGGEAVPKFVFCSADFVETGNWGPMSSTPRHWIARGKACNDVGAARKLVGEFYEDDNHRESTTELVDLILTAGFPGF